MYWNYQSQIIKATTMGYFTYITDKFKKQIQGAEGLKVTEIQSWLKKNSVIAIHEKCSNKKNQNSFIEFNH